MVLASIGAALLNIVLNALLIPKVGFLAAAYTTLFSYLVFAGANYAAMNKTLKKQENREKLFDLRTLVLILLAFFVLSYGAMLLYRYPVVRWGLAAAALAVLAFYGKKIIARLQGIRRGESE